MSLYVIRHGETDINVKHLINGINNLPLNENGILQAKNKQKEISNLNIDLIICSPLERTKQTCEYVNVDKVDVIYDERLVERNANSMQYESDKNIDMTLWYDEDKEIIYKDTEGFKSILKRVYSLLDEIK